MNCNTVFETDCKDVTSGYTTTEECTKWPKVKCDVKQLDNKKVTPISQCFKVPKEVCGAQGCLLAPGPEVCHDEIKTVIAKVNFITQFVPIQGTDYNSKFIIPPKVFFY